MKRSTTILLMIFGIVAFGLLMSYRPEVPGAARTATAAAAFIVLAVVILLVINLRKPSK